MTRDELTLILSNAVAIYGNDAQVNLALEEMGELIAAINNYRRGRCTAGDVVEELADVAIMLAQLALIFGKDQYDSAIMRKLLRLKERLDKHC